MEAGNLQEDAMNERVSSQVMSGRPAHGPAGADYMSGFGNTFETEALVAWWDLQTRDHVDSRGRW